ncbi:MAG: NADAR family protein [Bacteriovorax sp.]
MKIFAIFLLLNSCFALFASANEEIPHYKIYPRTPIVDYKEESLDFYSVKNLYGEFSNFALFPIVVDDVAWPSSEHYYQAQKFLDHDLQEKVRAAETPYLAAQIGRDPNLPMREDWDNVKDAVMLVALHAKFSQYKVLQELLLSTNQAKLYEHTKNDCYWADCEDRSGKNRLGEELMQIRKELQSQ